MTDLQAYLIILTGFIAATTIILTGNTKLCSWLIRLIMVLFILQTFFYVVRILSLPFPKNAVLALVEFCTYIGAYGFYAGCFIGYFLIALLFKEKIKIFDDLLFQNLPILYRWFRFATAALFFSSSLHSPFHFTADLKFFTFSGYSAAFFIFISIVEFSGAVGLLFRKTTLYACLLLMCDMLGAVYTHFHNYLANRNPDPLGDSIPSLITQTVLISIILITLYFNKKRVQTSTWIA